MLARGRAEPPLIDTNRHGLSRGNFFLNFHAVTRSELALQRVHTLSEKVFN